MRRGLFGYPLAFDPDGLDNRRAEAFAMFRPLIGFLERWHDVRIRGLERIPDGAALYVGNHNAATTSVDTFLWGKSIFDARGLDDVPFGLAHDTAMTAPFFHEVLAVLGGVRANAENARRIFEAGRKAIVYPGGDLDAMRPWRDRDHIIFGGRRGYIRLALRHGVPIVPIVAAGAHETFVVFHDFRGFARWTGLARHFRIKVLPVSWSIPWGLWVGPPLPFFPLPSRILIEFLEPIRFERSGEDAANDTEYVAQCAEHVERVMQQNLDLLVAERRRLGRWTRPLPGILRRR
jgi:1-acyl-sn-glycerol-3-phosphate acyltransferase